MGNIISYLRWRGDLLWSEAPFNEVDNLILACLSYFDFDGIVSETEKNPVSLMCAAENFFSEHRESKSPADPDLLKKPRLSNRKPRTRYFNIKRRINHFFGIISFWPLKI